MRTGAILKHYAFSAAAAGLLLTACLPDPIPPISPVPPAPAPAPGPGGPVIDRNPPSMGDPTDMAGNDLRGTGRAIMLRVRHTPDPQEPHQITLEKERVYVRRGDSGPITVTTSDQNGAVIDSWQAPDPLGSGEEPRLDEARYGVPYSPNLFLVTITDTRTGASTSAKVDDVVRRHCEGEPTDNICRDIDLRTDVTLDDYSVRTAAVGETVTVPVHVVVRNGGSDWADAQGSMFVFGILDGVSFTTADPATFSTGVLDPTMQSRYDVKYDLTCNVAGDHRVFVGAQFFDPAREAVDADPASNRWNTWFDVKCTAP